MPQIINNLPIKSGRKSKAVEYLNKNSLLLFNDFGNKDYVEHFLKENKVLEDLRIPVKIPKHPNDIIDMIDEYKKVILKPMKGKIGQDIFIIEKITKAINTPIKIKYILSKKKILLIF